MSAWTSTAISCPASAMPGTRSSVPAEPPSIDIAPLRPRSRGVFSENHHDRLLDVSRCRPRRIAAPYPAHRRPDALRGLRRPGAGAAADRSEEHTSELQSRPHLVCRLLLENKHQLVAQPPG